MFVLKVWDIWNSAVIVVKVGLTTGIDYDALCASVAALHKQGKAHRRSGSSAGKQTASPESPPEAPT